MSSELFDAVFYEDVDAVFASIFSDADVNASNAAGNRPLHAAAHAGNLRIAEILLRAGADPSARGRADNTPLHFAARNAHVEVAELLLNAGADPSLRNSRGFSPRDIVYAMGSPSSSSTSSLSLMYSDEKGLSERHQRLLEVLDASILRHSRVLGAPRIVLPPSQSSFPAVSPSSSSNIKSTSNPPLNPLEGPRGASFGISLLTNSGSYGEPSELTSASSVGLAPYGEGADGDISADLEHLQLRRGDVGDFEGPNSNHHENFIVRSDVSWTSTPSRSSSPMQPLIADHNTTRHGFRGGAFGHNSEFAKFYGGGSSSETFDNGVSVSSQQRDEYGGGRAVLDAVKPLIADVRKKMNASRPKLGSGGSARSLFPSDETRQRAASTKSRSGSDLLQRIQSLDSTNEDTETTIIDKISGVVSSKTQRRRPSLESELGISPSSKSSPSGSIDTSQPGYWLEVDGRQVFVKLAEDDDEDDDEDNHDNIDSDVDDKNSINDEHEDHEDDSDLGRDQGYYDHYKNQPRLHERRENMTTLHRKPADDDELDIDVDNDDALDLNLDDDCTQPEFTAHMTTSGAHHSSGNDVEDAGASSQQEDAGLQEYSVHLVPSEVGLGMQLMESGRYTCVSALHPAGPAYAAHVREGDMLIRMNDCSTEGLTVAAVKSLLSQEAAIHQDIELSFVRTLI